MKNIITICSKFILKLSLLLIVLNTYAQEITDDSEYHPNAIRISKIGVNQGRDAINKELIEFQNIVGHFVDYKTIHKLPVLQALDYEIRLSETSKGKKFAHIVIRSKESVSQKMAEVVFEKTDNLEIPAELSKARQKWVVLCNKHNSRNLVTELYTDDAIYYNRGRVLRGHEQLSNEYIYMDNPSYTLQLNPTHVEMVTSDMIFEIGKCSGSYPLPYILVWKKENDGSWKIYFDSNY